MSNSQEVLWVDGGQSKEVHRPVAYDRPMGVLAVQRFTDQNPDSEGCYEIEHNEDTRETTVQMSYTERDTAITTIVKRYQEDPYVVAKVNRRRKSSKKSTRQFDLLTDDQTRQLFSMIDDGLAVYVKQSNLDSVENPAAVQLMDLVYAYQVVSCSNLGLVAEIAKRYYTVSNMEYADLMQEGSIGLSMAIKRFDIKQNVQFSTYAYPWITQSIQRAIDNKSEAIKLPADVRSRIRKMQTAYQELNSQPGISDLEQEVRARTGFSEKIVRTLKTIEAQKPISYHNARSSDDLREIIDTLPDFESGDIINNIADRSMLKQIFQEADLDDLMKFIVVAHFGLPGEWLKGVQFEIKTQQFDVDDFYSRLENQRQLNLRDLGELLNVSVDFISRRYNLAIGKLRDQAKQSDI